MSIIKVLVVEDSPVVREFLIHVLSADPGIRVIGTAHNGEEALDAVRRYQPDVITMDIHMPKMNGLEATRRIMETDPRPIVIVSGSYDPGEIATTFEAMEAGALAVLSRPAGVGHADYDASARELVQMVKLMSEVKVVRRWPRVRRDVPAPVKTGLAHAPAQIRVVAIGASTGGPPVLHTILSGLPKDFPAPILIVQHMAAGFIQGFAEWLAHSSPLPIHVATHGEFLLPGHVYMAPDAFQMKVERGGKINLTRDEPENGLRPSVACLFRSVAEVYASDAVAGLLSGMGRDGAEQLKRLKEQGAVTFAQDKDSSVVHGMPGEAIKLDAVMLVLPPENIAPMLINLAYNGYTRGRKP
ncbi:chemotaxis-specific protein-glutamate methyltransferase CheB [Rhodoferax sp.]|uniref:chemotaxis-specific protein-glutamate methyltransferase CheB n=1 Tax=Rhodoferax sp. TaxID=50421 RepID=UPI0039B8DC92